MCQALQPLVQPTPASITQPIEPTIQHRPIPPYHEPFVQPPPRPPDVTAVKDNRKDLSDFDMDGKIEFEENSPHQEGIISEMYERPDKSYIQEPTVLKDLIETTKLIQKFLPRQADIDKILDVTKRKVLNGTHLPLTIKEIQAGYLTSPYFNFFNFFIPGLMHYLRSFIKGCHTCHLTRADKPPTRHLQPRIYLNYRPLSRLAWISK